MLRALRASPSALLVLVNKIDLLREGSSLSKDKRAALGTEDEVLQRWRNEFPGASVLPVSARQKAGVEDVFERVRALLPLHPPFFPKDQLTDKPERFFASEMLRESIFELYSQVGAATDHSSPDSAHFVELCSQAGDCGGRDGCVSSATQSRTPRHAPSSATSSAHTHVAVP